MSEPKLSPGSGGIRHIHNPVQQHQELGITNREQVYDETPIVIPGLGTLRGEVKSRAESEPRTVSARVLKRRRFRAQRKKETK